MAIANQLYAADGTGGTPTNPMPASALGVYNQLTAYQTGVASDAAAFSGYATLATDSKSGVSAQITQYTADIAAANKAMAKDRAMIAGGAVLIVAGVLICVAAVALAPETGGRTIAAIATVGVAAVAGGAVMIGAASHDLDTKEQDVAKKLIAIHLDCIGFGGRVQLAHRHCSYPKRHCCEQT